MLLTYSAIHRVYIYIYVCLWLVIIIAVATEVELFYTRDKAPNSSERETQCISMFAYLLHLSIFDVSFRQMSGCWTRGWVQNYPGWDEGWLTIVRHRIQVEDEVVEDIADLDLDGVEVESQVTVEWLLFFFYSLVGWSVSWFFGRLNRYCVVDSWSCGLIYPFFN